MKSDFPYEDIIDAPHFHDVNRPYMSNMERAAQFMPFKSLNEYSDYIYSATDEADHTEDAGYLIIDE